MNEEQLNRAIDHLAKELVPNGVDLWPAIQSHFMMSKKHSSQGVQLMKINLAHSRRLRLASFFLVILFAIAVLSFLTIPSLQTFAQEILGFSVKTKDIQIILTSTPVLAVNPIEVPTLVQTVEQQMKATEQKKNLQTSPETEYSIKLPTMLPEGWKIGNIQMGMNGNAWVNFVYEPGGCLMDLIINPAQGLDGTIIGPEGKVETVTMGNLTAEYVRGSWTTKDGHGVLHQVIPDEAKDLSWVDDSGTRKLRWGDGNLNYLLVSYGASAGEQGYLGKADLSIIADSFNLVTRADVSWPTPKVFTPNNGTDEIDEDAVLNPNQLEALAGFDILAPAYLPENYQYDHGNHYSMGGIAVDLYYSCGNNPDLPRSSTFYIYQVKMSAAEYQWELENLPKDEVGESAQIETVLINGVPAEYIKGNWRDVIDTSSGTPIPVKRVWENSLNSYSLKWYTNGVFYVMRTGNWGDDIPAICILTKEDFIAIAQSLK